MGNVKVLGEYFFDCFLIRFMGGYAVVGYKRAYLGGYTGVFGRRFAS